MSALIPAPQSSLLAPAGGQPPDPHLSPDRGTDRGTDGGTDRGADGGAGRSQTVDVVRAVCVLVVVALHALMVGVERSPDGGLSTQVALAGTAWFAPASWLIQVMPLFFIVGGFASAHHWRRMRSRGGASADFVRSRVRRLALPAAVMILVVGAALALANGLGVDPDLLAEARLRIAQPLWFLAVYTGVTAMVPIMMRLHESRPVATLLGLGAGIVGVDAVRLAADLPAVGCVNLAFVWLLMQQLGFVQSDGRMEAWSSVRVRAVRRPRALTTSGGGSASNDGVPRGAILSVFALGLLQVAVTMSPYSADMLVNLNPPTAALALLGVAQFFALCVLKPWMDRRWDATAAREWDAATAAREWDATAACEWDAAAGRGGASRGATSAARRSARRARSIARAGSVMSAGSMTLYLWHMPVVLGLAAAVWAVDLPLPAPHSGTWWLTRIPWLVALALALGGAYAVRKALKPLLRIAVSRTSVRWLAASRASLSRTVSSHGATTTTVQAALFVLSAIAGVLITLFCLGDIIPSVLVSSALLTLCIWSAWGRRGWTARPS